MSDRPRPVAPAGSGWKVACALSAFVVALVVALVPAVTVVAERPFRKDKVDRAVSRAVRYLVSQQNGQAGFICDRPANRTAITSLAVLAMAAAGHGPADSTSEGRAMKRALRYVLMPERQDEDGYFGKRDGSKMYGHGMATLMLAEMLGQGADEGMDRLIRTRLGKAVKLILRAQEAPKGEAARGGWRYKPDDEGADISVTVWQILALRSAKNAGIEVASRAIDDALAYVKRCYLSDLDARGRPLRTDIGFGYSPGSAKYMSTSTTSMGLLALHLCGERDSPFCRGAAGWLTDHPPAWGHRWLFYGMYYYAQAMYQEGGKHAETGRRTVQKLLLPEQRPDGSWESSSAPERLAGTVYSTSLGALALGVRSHFLPVYQR